jgi:hypothetical protein
MAAVSFITINQKTGNGFVLAVLLPRQTAKFLAGLALCTAKS